MWPNSLQLLMPTFNGWTAQISLASSKLSPPLLEELVMVDRSVVTCDIPCHPGKVFVPSYLYITPSYKHVFPLDIQDFAHQSKL